jgi:serine/threonine-protein kinase
MEFVDGETVENMIDREGPLDVRRAIEIVIQMLRSITYITRFDIVHRDIKPGNIMITLGGLVKLGDFGFVKSKLDPVIATEGEVLGTPDYISPEQALGMENIDWRSDQYSLGCTLYHMLTGRPPYEGSGSSVMRQHIKADLPDPRTINAKIPDSVVQILERMMAKDPDDRYQDTDLFYEDLDLVKMGNDPSTQRLDAGKSTIIRAFKIEQVKALRAKTEVEILRDEVIKLKRLLVISLAGAGVLLIAGLVLAFGLVK